MSALGPRALVALLALCGASADAGGRAHYGGTVKVAAVARTLETDPLLADTPVEVAARALTSSPPCRLGELSRPSPGTVRLTLAPGVKAEVVAKALETVRSSASPYAALLSSVRSVAAAPGAVELQLSTPAAELERLLCHPALSTPIGPFRPAAAEATANPSFPQGRPYLDAVAVAAADARGAERLLGQRRVQVVLGAGSGDEGALLYATYLVAAPDRADLARAVDSAVERKDLARFFVRAPASPLYGLLPASLGGPPAVVAPATRPAIARPDATLLYDAALDDQRAVAERIQVKLQPLGLRVALQGLPRRELRERWRTGRYDMALLGVMLPPVPEGAFELARRLAHDASPSLVTAPDAAGRDKAFRDAALAAQVPGFPVVPLYVQGLAVTTSRDVLHVSRDAYGTVRLDDVFLAPE